MIQLDWPLEVSVGRSIAAAMLHFLLPLNSCRLWGEDDADCGEGDCQWRKPPSLRASLKSFQWKHICLERMNVLHICPQVMFNIWYFELKTKFTAHVKLKIVEMLRAGEAVKPRKRGSRRFWFAAHLHQAETPQTPHYTPPADWIRAVFPSGSMSSQFHQKYRKR